MSLDVPTPVLIALAGIYGLLAIATLIIYLSPYCQPEQDFTELKDRMKTWWIVTTLFALALVVGRAASIILFGFISFLAFKEYLSLIPTRRADHRVLFWAYVAILLQYVWIYIGW